MEKIKEQKVQDFTFGWAVKKIDEHIKQGWFVKSMVSIDSYVIVVFEREREPKGSHSIG